MAGVRLATGYIEISAEVSKVPQQIQDALSKAGTQAAKPVGEQIGKDINQGIQDGLRSIPTSSGGGSVISDVVQGKTTIGPNVRAQGQKVGKELGTGINEGVQQSTTTGGTKLDDTITKAAKPKETGQQVGRDIGKAVNDAVDEAINSDKGPGGVIKAAGKAAVKELADEVKRGDVKGAFSDVGDVVANTTNAISNMGSAVGVHLDSVEKLGSETATALDKVADVIQPAIDKIKGVADAVKTLKSGDVLSGAGSLTEALQGVMPQSVLDHANSFLDIYKNAHETVKGFRDTAAEYAEILGGAGWLGRFAGPVGAVATGGLAGWQVGQAYGKYLTEANKWVEMPEVPQGPYYGPQGQPLTPAGQPFTPSPTPTVPPSQVHPYVPGEKSYAPPPATAAPPGRGGTPAQPGQFKPSDIGNWSNALGRAVTAADVVAPTGPVAPSVTQPFISGTTAAPAPAPAAAGGGQIAHATESIGTASISVGSASISGVSVPSTTLPSAAAAAATGGTWWGTKIGSHQDGGPITDDELAKLHKGEHVATTDQVKNAGGHDNMAGIVAGTTPHPAMAEEQAKQITEAIDTARTMGFIPAGAGSKAVAGTSSLAGLFNLGNEAVGGLIDTGAAAAQTALSMAASAGSFGAGGQAAGALGGIGIQLLASEGKRAASYGFQMASILADSVVDQIFGPFGGPPRWIGYDYTQFLPNLNISQIGTTTVEKAMQAGMKPGQTPGGPVTPEHLAGEQPVGPPVPKFGEPAQPQALGVPAEQQAPKGGVPPPGAPPSGGAPPPGPPPTETGAPGVTPTQAPPIDPIQMLLGGMQTADEGGWLMPNTPVINTTGRPELMIPADQLDAMKTSSNKNPYNRGGDTYNITAVDADDVGRQIDKRKRLAMMQYSGRP